MSVISYFFGEIPRYSSILGIFCILVIGFLTSVNRKKINIRLVLSALGLQFFLAIFMLKIPFGMDIVNYISKAIMRLYQFSFAGMNFVFGALAVSEGTSWGNIFAFQVLPMIIFFGAFMSLLFYFGIVQFVVSLIGKVVRPLLGTSGSETLCAISNSFLGQTEAPLLVKEYLKTMTKSEFFVVMVSGMGTVSGTLLAVFSSFGVPLEHLLTASVMAIPGTILMAKMMIPQEEKVKLSDVTATFADAAKNPVDAISRGTVDGLNLALNVGAMLLAFLSLVALANALLGNCSLGVNNFFELIGLSWKLPSLSLNLIFSWICYPFAWFLGLSGADASAGAQLIGTKVAINEFIAFTDMLKMNLSPRAVSLLTYALCGFSNFSCIGIQIGGIGVLAPSTRPWLCELGLRCVFAAALANLLSAMMIGLLI
ncbi:NupC/NupG family nucleoside CNT transporter [bacterium]|nr:NupC/NupG family nucleoside CNT transporter [bacterium]